MSKPIVNLCRIVAAAVLMLCVLSLTAHAQAAADPLPSWNEGPAKNAIIKLVTATTTAGSADFVAPGDRFTTFDQDGTLWSSNLSIRKSYFRWIESSRWRRIIRDGRRLSRSSR